jgi:hypothetical protein
VTRETSETRLRLEPFLRRFLPGQTVTLGWPPPPGEADEFEVLLEPLLPAGPTLRIAEGQLPAPPEWRVILPNLLLGEVRLLLRVGREGLGETLWASSASFLLGFSPVAPPSEVRWRFGEWTLGEEAPPDAAGSLAFGASFWWDSPPLFFAAPSEDWRTFSGPALWGRLAMRARPGSLPEGLAAPPAMDRLPLLEVLRI